VIEKATDVAFTPRVDMDNLVRQAKGENVIALSGWMRVLCGPSLASLRCSEVFAGVEANEDPAR
jgi:hypothetical protein